MEGGLTYAEVGCTRPAEIEWPSGPFRYQASVRVGAGDECWTTSRAAVLRWAVKTRSGFHVVSAGATSPTQASDWELQLRVGPVTIREPVRVVAVVDEPDRAGFAYGTRQGHPVSGEEAFVVHRDGAGAVWFTLRSFTRPADGWRRAAFPVFLLAQRLFRRRYLAALK